LEPTMPGRAITNFFERGVMNLAERWRRYIEVQGEYVSKVDITV